MEAFSQHEGTLNYSRPDKQGAFYEDNLFLKEAGEAMGLPQQSGAKVARRALKAVYESLSSSNAKKFREALPSGLKQECELFAASPPREAISPLAVKNDIQEASNLEHVDPEEVAKSFWSYLQNWLEKNDKAEEGLSQDLLRDMPSEMAKLFSQMDEKWPQDLL